MLQIYLGEDYTIPKDMWHLLLAKDDLIFAKDLFVNLYGGERLLRNRCIDLKRVSYNLLNRSPRKEVTPKKLKVVVGNRNIHCNDFTE